MINPLRSAVVRPIFQSATIMILADITTQLLVEKRSLYFAADDQTQTPTRHEPAAVEERTASSSSSPTRLDHHYDPMRTLRWATIGLTLHGPYFFLTFRKLDRLMTTTTTTNSLFLVAKKTAIAQLVIFPPYLVALFAYLGVMEQSGGSSNVDYDEIATRVRVRVPEAFASGCMFWPFANGINFAFVPAGMRVPYLASVGGLWNGYLSNMNARKGGDGK
mmetsp:Transcript_20342/g.37063  ORF Transcript_20342/g.37063 Transcript_20342/m.37063 type:complete len:219 (-) Transcript_20342:294-950(-)